MQKKSTSLTSRSLSAIKWNYFGVGVRVFAQFVVQIALARLLGPEVLGVFAIVFLAIGFGSVLVESGLGAALVQRDVISDENVRFTFTWTALMGVVVAVLVGVSSDYIATQFGNPDVSPVLKGITPVFLLQALSIVPMSLLRRELAFKKIQFVQIGSYLFGFLVVGVGCAVSGFEVWSLVAAWIAQSATSAIFLSYLVKYSKKPFFSADKLFYKFCAKVVFVNIANWVIENIDNFLIGKIFGSKSLGVYSVSYNLVRTPANHLVVTLQGVLFPASSRAQNNLEQLNRAYLIVVAAVALVAMPVFSSVAVVSNTVIEALFGQRWLDAAPVLVPLSLAMIPHALMAIAGPILWGRGRVGDELGVQVFVAILLAVAILSLAYTSMELAAWVVFLVYMVRFLAITVVLARRLSLTAQSFIHALRGGVAGTCAVISVLWIVEASFQSVSATTRLVCELFSAASILVALILFFPRYVLSAELILLVAGICQRFPSLRKNPLLRRFILQME